MKSTIPAPSPTDATAAIVAPQAGLAYRLPGGAGVLRAGYGLQYGPILPSSYAWIRSNPPANTVLMIQQPNLIQALTAASGTSFAGATQGRPFFTILDPNMVLPVFAPVQLQLGAGVARILARSTGLLGSDTFKLIMMRSSNRGLIVPGMTLTEANVDQRRPNQNYSSMRDIENGANALYNAATASLFLPRWKGLHVDVSYWFSKAMDDGAGFADQGPLR